jgi:hypothetical protein
MAERDAHKITTAEIGNPNLPKEEGFHVDESLEKLTKGGTGG